MTTSEYLHKMKATDFAVCGRLSGERGNPLADLAALRSNAGARSTAQPCVVSHTNARMLRSRLGSAKPRANCTTIYVGLCVTGRTAWKGEHGFV